MSSKPLFPIREEDPSEVSVRKDSESDFSRQPAEPFKIQLIAVIADEDTCVGYLLGGIGQLNALGYPNFYIFNEKSMNIEIEFALDTFLHRSDIGIILIQKEAAELVLHTIRMYRRHVPVIVEIPGKNGPYDVSIDHILEMAASHEKEEVDKLQDIKMTAHGRHPVMDVDAKSSRDSTDSSISGHYAENIMKYDHPGLA
ncbi:hypothetical protein JTB14_017457 [Gonioctena quinquepunctata]|nr:hypothetical protein JTB14_017457 [Gonioctena quinquepunctata]